MKTLVVYFSRTGNTKKVGEEIARILKADVDEIKDEKDRRGIFGYLKAGKDAMGKKLTKISYKKKPENYQRVIIGTPIWGWRMCPAIRTYLWENKDKIKKADYFCTQGGNGGDKTLEEMEGILGKGRKLILLEKEVKSGEFKKKVEEFCSKSR